MSENEYNGAEKRKHPRASVNFVVNYSLKDSTPSYDLSQTKNLSQGGMMLTTNREFPVGTVLDMIIRLPFVSQRINLTGVVVESTPKVKNLLYETRLRFDIEDENFFKELGEFIEVLLKNRRR
ncbi:MAG: PilZ domain-containing protein [Candidatus Omnitrophica bacterium]|jgi:Tfp pilus assembly protein PilZ|nr:PilZ domain-containing protein [Candidatus Omnitrophota bacterium]MDD5080498.1 PilZ domain-containing protein [Candidatus Omnitrophota bacterium]MDD5441067.1 PilZ domain-containing protein [Candidatus Omnitrophota bacterium]